MSMTYPYPYTKWDEYHLHQTSDVITVPLQGDASFLDHNCTWAHSTGVGPYVYIAFYTSPNTGVKKSAASVNWQGKQYQIRCVTEYMGDPTVMEIGPTRETIDEPMVQRTVSLAENPYIPVSFELVARAAFPMFDLGLDHGLEEPRSGRGMHWFSQLMTFDGEITVEGEKFSAAGYVGERDRGWGVTGQRARDERSVVGFWLYLHFEKFGLQLFYAEDEETRPVAVVGGFNYKDGSVKFVRKVRHDLAFEKGTRLWTKYEMELGMENGETHTLTCKRLGEWNSFAGWSMRPTRDENGKVIRVDSAGMGSRRLGDGPLVIEADILDRTDPEFLNNVASHHARQTPVECTLDGEVGYGVVEDSLGKKSQYGWML
jgi:hypothetical protein